MRCLIAAPRWLWTASLMSCAKPWHNISSKSAFWSYTTRSSSSLRSTRSPRRGAAYARRMRSTIQPLKRIRRHSRTAPETFFMQSAQPLAHCFSHAGSPAGRGRRAGAPAAAASWCCRSRARISDLLPGRTVVSCRWGRSGLAVAGRPRGRRRALALGLVIQRRARGRGAVGRAEQSCGVARGPAPVPRR